MSRGKKLALLLAVILVLGAAAGFLLSSQSKKAAQEAQAEEAKKAEEDAKIPDTVYFVDSSNITALEWTSLKKAGACEKKDDKWIVADDDGKEYDCDTSKVEPLLNAVRFITADRVIENPGDLAQFGFNDPCAVIRITAGGKTVELTIGDPVQSNKELYYCTSSESSNLYLVSDSLPQAFYVVRGELLPQSN